MLFCRKIYFVGIYALLCEKKFRNKSYQWRKMTNMRYALYMSNSAEQKRSHICLVYLLFAGLN